jgi:hypothetical protein
MIRSYNEVVTVYLRRAKSFSSVQQRGTVSQKVLCSLLMKVPRRRLLQGVYKYHDGEKEEDRLPGR